MRFRDYSKYEVYEDGRIWSYRKKKFLKPATLPNGYQVVFLYDNEGNRKMYYLHRVVYESVTGEPIPECYEINHISEDKTENFFGNLELMTPKQNINYGSGIARRAKTQSKQVGAYKDGNLVMTFPSTMEAQRQGFNFGNVAACCRGERKTHKGYTWRYLN